MAFGDIWVGNSGLLNQQTFIDTVSNNIANSNTVGFKRSNVNFHDVFNQTLSPGSDSIGNRSGINPKQKGFGIAQPDIVRDISQGNIEKSDIPTNIAILGDGYFILRDPYNTDQSYYTRAGDFVFDGNMSLVNASNGYYVQGVVSTYNTTTGQYEIQGTTPANISNLPTTLPGQASTRVDLLGNLNAEGNYPIDPADIQYDRAISVLSNRGFVNTTDTVVPTPWPVQSVASFADVTDEVVPASNTVPQYLKIRYSDNDLESFTINAGMTLTDTVNSINSISTDVTASAYQDPDNSRYYLRLTPTNPNGKSVYQVYESPDNLSGFTEGYIPNQSENFKILYTDGTSTNIKLNYNSTLQDLVDSINNSTSKVTASITQNNNLNYLQLTATDPTIGISSIPTFPPSFNAKFDDPSTGTDESIDGGFTSGLTTNNIEFRFTRVSPTEQIYMYKAYDSTGSQVTTDDNGLSIQGLIKLNSEGKVVGHYTDTTGTDEFIGSASEEPTDSNRFGIVNTNNTVDGYDFYTVNGVDVLIPNGVSKMYQPDQTSDLSPETFTIKAKTSEGLKDSVLSLDTFTTTSDLITGASSEIFQILLNGSTAQQITMPASSTVQDFITAVNDPLNGIAGVTAEAVVNGTTTQVRLYAATGGDTFRVTKEPSGFSKGFQYELGNLGVNDTSISGAAELKDNTDFLYGFGRTVYDSAGNQHDLNFQYQHLAQNKYLYSISPEYKETFVSATLGDNTAGGGTSLDGITLSRGDLKLKNLTNNLYDVSLSINEGSGDVEFTQVSSFPSTGSGTNYFMVTDPATGAIALSRDISATATASIKYNRTEPEGYGILAFDKNGLYDASNSIEYKQLGWTPEGANALAITLNYADAAGNIQVVQQGGPSEMDVKYSDGFATGNLTDIEFADEGKINGLFDNGKSAILAQVLLQQFVNPQGLTAEGENMFKDSINAGKYDTVSIADTGSAGRIASYSLESSNVDMAKEFVDLILAQRSFQGNSRLVTTSDSLIKTAIDMKR